MHASLIVFIPFKMAARIISVLVLLCCVSESWQRCFSDHCAHHSPLTGCLGGAYRCSADEFCETTTHLSHGNSPWVVMNCRPQSQMADCLAVQASNDPNCDPNKHDRICHWCCTDEQCMRDLATGVSPTATAPLTTMQPTVTIAPDVTTIAPAATTMAPAATTMAPAATTMAPAASTMAPAASTMAPAASTMAPMASTMAPAGGMPTTQSSAVCEDVYLGDCSVDYAGRCAEPLIHQLCQKTCGLCA